MGKKNDDFVETLLTRCLKAFPVYLKTANHCLLAFGVMKQVHSLAVSPRHGHFKLAEMGAILLPLLHEVVSSRSMLFREAR